MVTHAVTASDELVEGLRRGDARAFDQAFMRFRPRIYGFLARLTGHPALAEDLLQETFVRLARHAPTLAVDTRLEAWLFTVARNLYLSHRRWALLDLERLSELRLWSMLAPPPESPLAHAANDQELALLEQAIASLPLTYREVILLVGVEGMSPSEAATILGTNGAAVRQRLARARARMSDLMERLRRMPAHDVSGLRAAQMQARVRAAFVSVHRQSARFEGLRVAYRRYLEPAWVTALGAAYLAWAFLQVIELGH
jgi:RNA polymerase sigma-70 factor (ECF subfamily)